MRHVRPSDGSSEPAGPIVPARSTTPAGPTVEHRDPGAARGRGRSRVLRTALAAACGLALLPALPPVASADVPGDSPAGALPFLPADAENGPVTDLQRTLVLDTAGPDAAAPRCFGGSSFQRTAWLTIESSAKPRRLSIEAAAKDGSTATPDLAAYVQPGASGSDVHEPQACSGRETAGDPARGDLGASTVLVVPAGAAVLVQVGWRTGDAPVPVVASLAATTLPALPAPEGQAFATAPFAFGGTGQVVGLTGATTTFADPAEPRCASEAGVWRRVRIARKGVYATAVAGATAGAITVFSTTPSGSTAVACADDGVVRAGYPILTTVFRARRTGTYWLRVGANTPESPSRAGLSLLGPYATTTAGRAAAPAASDRANRALDPKAPCTDRRAPHPGIGAAALRSLRRGGRVIRGVNDGAACADGRSTVSRFTVAVARVRGGRCAWLTGRTFGRPRSCASERGLRRATGRDTWRTTLPVALPRGGTYRVVVHGQVRRKGKVRTSGTRFVTTVRR